jgi:hypothetical protein
MVLARSQDPLSTVAGLEAAGRSGSWESGCWEVPVGCVPRMGHADGGEAARTVPLIKHVDVGAAVSPVLLTESVGDGVKWGTVESVGARDIGLPALVGK